MDVAASFFWKTLSRQGGKASPPAFPAVSKPLPILMAVITPGLKGVDDYLHQLIGGSFIHGCRTRFGREGHTCSLRYNTGRTPVPTIHTYR